MAGSKTLFGSIKLKGSLADGTGDPLLTKDPTTNEVGTAANALGSLEDGKIFIGDASNVPQPVAVSGDITLSNAGVAAISAGAVVNADINAAAGIQFSKMENLTASRALVSDANGDVSVSSVTATELGYLSGVTSAIQTQLSGKQATITGAATTITSSNLTASRALVSNSSGKVSAASVTSTELGYLSGVTSSIQTQLNGKLSATVSSVAQGDILYYNGTGWVNLPRGSAGQALLSTSTTVEWGAVTANGLPAGGTDGQVLTKQSGTDFDADWESLTVSSITDLTATAAELNILDGATIDVTELNFLENASANIQDQLNNKMSSTLATDHIFKGVGGVATASTDLPTGITIGGSAIYRASGADVSLADGGTGASLTDPGADRIMFWDDSAGQVTWLEVGGGLSINDTTITGVELIDEDDMASDSDTKAPTQQSVKAYVDAQVGGITSSSSSGPVGTIQTSNGAGGFSGLNLSVGTNSLYNRVAGQNWHLGWNASGTGGSADSRRLTIGAVGIAIGPFLTDPLTSLHVEKSISGGGSTGITGEALRLRSTYNAITATVGSGVRMSFESETADDNYEIGAIIEAVTTDVTSNSEDFDLVFKTMSNGAAPEEVFRLKSAGNIIVPTTVTSGGTTGDRTINKISGTVNFAPSATSITVTNNLVTENSIVFAVVRTNDATATIKNVVPSAGSFTINLTAGATAETSVGFFVIN